MNSTVHGDVNLGKLITAIDGSTATEAEKAEAKSLLKKTMENPVVQALAGVTIKALGSTIQNQ